MTNNDKSLRTQFPIFSGQNKQYPFAYLDSANTTQKPRVVVERMSQYMLQQNANVQRGAYHLSAQASEFFEESRQKVASFIGAASAREVIFTRGTTDSFNLLSSSFSETLEAGDTILVSVLEHHSNFVPWQLAAQRHGLKLVFAPISKDADIDEQALFALIEKERPKLVSLVHLSNAFGSHLDCRKIAQFAHDHGALLALDCAQSIAHQPIDVAQLGADFVAFSGHKLYGPTGIGVLWGREALLERLPPYQGGGGMIGLVSVEGTSWAALPQRLEAGTPAIAEVIGLGAAIDFVRSIGFEEIERREREIFDYAWEKLTALPRLTAYGPRHVGRKQSSIISFSVADIHPHDLATVLDSRNVQLRAGHHCAMPALHFLGLPATARISFALYSEREDIDQLVSGIEAAQEIFV
jgi:cysteine desulfurase / selenocysteine lyase